MIQMTLDLLQDQLLLFCPIDQNCLEVLIQTFSNDLSNLLVADGIQISLSKLLLSIDSELIDSHCVEIWLFRVELIDSFKILHEYSFSVHLLSFILELNLVAFLPSWENVFAAGIIEANQTNCREDNNKANY